MYLISWISDLYRAKLTLLNSHVSLVKTGEEQLTGEENSSAVDVTQTEWFRDGLTRVNLGFTNAYINEKFLQNYLHKC